MNCAQCKKKVEKIEEKISFHYKNHVLTVNNEGKYCPDCLKSRWKEAIEKHPDLFYIKNEGEIGINWKFYLKMPEGSRAKNEAIKLLYSLGIFSTDPEGNWEIVATGPVGLNPRLMTDLYLYFTRKDDAIEFAKISFTNSLYHWQIHKISEVIPKSAIIF